MTDRTTRARLDLGLALLLIRATKWGVAPSDPVLWAELEAVEKQVQRVRNTLERTPTKQGG